MMRDAMRIVIIVADGEPYEKLPSKPTAEMMTVGDSYKVERKRNRDQNLQAMEFWNSGVQLAQSLTQPLVIWVPKRVFHYDNSDEQKRPRDEERKFRAPENAEVRPYDSAREVADFLEQGAENWQLIVVFGHGAQYVRLDGEGAADGAVELCAEGGRTQRCLDPTDFARSPKCVYIGLHCYALTFAKGIPRNTPAFHLSGEEKTTHGKIARFLECCTTRVRQLCFDLSDLDEAGPSEWKALRDKAQNTLNALDEAGKKIEDTHAGVLHQLPDQPSKKSTPHPDASRARISLPQPPVFDRGKLGEHAERKSKGRNAFSRVSPVTIRSGYRVGIATWNAHGLSKRSDESADDDDDDAPLAVITEKDLTTILWLIEARTALKEGITEILARVEEEENDGNVRALAAQLDLALGPWLQPYVGKQMLCYQQLTAPLVTKGVDSPVDRQALDTLVARIEKELDEINLKVVVPRLLTRKLACLAILELFRRHTWLDILVVQEVKFTGIDLLVQQVKNELSVYAGPLMKSSGSKKGGEHEYYPMIMRKDARSINHQQERHLIVDRIWWLAPTGESEELAQERITPNTFPQTTWKTVTTGKRQKMRRVSVPPTPDLTWDKRAHKASFRPVVNYDLMWKDTAVRFHVGVVHTTPGTGGEFNREYEFDQIESMLENVSARATSSKEEDAAFAGPWLLAGDYYLFKDSRITSYANNAVDAEFRNRLEEYRENGKNAPAWLELRKTWRTVRREAKKLPKHILIATLASGSQALAKSAVEGTALTRSRVRAHRECWWIPKQGYTEIADEDPEMLFELCRKRGVLYSELYEFCTFHQNRAKYLSGKAEQNFFGKWRALLKDNAAVLRFRPSTFKDPKAPWEPEKGPANQKNPGKRKRSGKSKMDVKISVETDPTRATFGQRFVDFVDDTPVEITQAVAGTNTHLFHDFLLDDTPDPEQEAAYDLYLEKKAYYAAHLKVADFIVHTAYDDDLHGTDGHWRGWCLGLLCPDVGRIVLADSDDLAVSRFWACFSDHFPVGGLFSTRQGENEEKHLYERIVRQDESHCLFEKARRLEKERLLQKWEDLQVLAELLKKPELQKNTPPDDQLAAGICELEAVLYPHEEDRGSKDFAIGVLEYGWNGVLDFLRFAEFAEEGDGENVEDEEEDDLEREHRLLIARANALFEEAAAIGKEKTVSKFESVDSVQGDADGLRKLVAKLERVVTGVGEN